MNFYTYSAPGTGVNADELRNEETWKGYFDAGLNVMTLYGGNAYSGEVWETSNTKKCFDIAKKNGITKILLDDMRIYIAEIHGNHQRGALAVGNGDAGDVQWV